MVERGNKLRALREELGIYRFQLDLLKLLNRKQMSIDDFRGSEPLLEVSLKAQNLPTRSQNAGKVFRLRQDTRPLAYESEAVVGVDPAWKRARVPMSRVDVTRPIRFEIWAQGASGIPDLIGKCEARVSELLMMPGDHTLPITSRARFSQISQGGRSSTVSQSNAKSRKKKAPLRTAASVAQLSIGKRRPTKLMSASVARMDVTLSASRAKAPASKSALRGKLVTIPKREETKSPLLRFKRVSIAINEMKPKQRKQSLFEIRAGRQDKPEKEMSIVEKREQKRREERQRRKERLQMLEQILGVSVKQFSIFDEVAVEGGGRGVVASRVVESGENAGKVRVDLDDGKQIFVNPQSLSRI